MSDTAYLLTGPNGEDSYGWFVLTSNGRLRGMVFRRLYEPGAVAYPTQIRDGELRIAETKPTEEVLNNG